MKKIYGIIAIFFSLSLILPGYMSDDTIEADECIIPLLKLPSEPATLYVWLFPEGWPAAYKAELTDITETDVDVTNGIYKAWCVDFGTPIPGGYDNPYVVTLYNSYYPPERLTHENWTKINYILNNAPTDSDPHDVQRALWYFINFGPWDWDYTGYGPMSKPVDQATWDMIADANENSDDWCPGCGDTIAVICDPGEEHGFQITIIEVPFPCYEGATPGFWKNKGLKVGWPAPYISDMTLDEAGFIIHGDSMTDNPKRPVFSDDTLLEALNYKGGENLSGMAQTLLRAATAAILNAAHPEINYPLMVADIINQVNAALASEERTVMEELKNELDTYNNYKFEEWW